MKGKKGTDPDRPARRRHEGVGHGRPELHPGQRRRTWASTQDFFETHDLHIHVPAGAIPKDGPSAGVTMLTALTSLLTGRIVRKDLAMTGEITLRGQVLPVGGVKEKVLAAHRAGIKSLILPKWNEKDLEDIPKKVQKEIEFHYVDKMLDVIKIAIPK